MTATQQGRDEVASNGKEPRRIDMPMLGIEIRRREVEMPHVPMPHVPMPHISKQEFGHYVDVARTILPPPERVAYYGALGALAIFGAIEWPVAAAIGVGMAITQRGRQGSAKPDMPVRGQQQAQGSGKPGTPVQRQQQAQGGAPVPAQQQEQEPKKRRAAAAQQAVAGAARNRKSAPQSK
ncbi:hypothetical protein LDL08_19040 [Nonomuraea glycinis]|uniref:Uncharacterized protein n=1 Tax=Nonomuraea glycinis TaxID=2047744 RepID=A0A918ACQ6_9ACTN|nr:hypothetical protein [Nonomuraea glycinis]MCA2178289.1 hypothetical protein [Nonomuraea glycinis]GGP12565.1 hypothetical protein GCM10012278_60870 [Nonomuraea glycinis]